VKIPAFLARVPPVIVNKSLGVDVAKLNFELQANVLLSFHLNPRINKSNKNWNGNPSLFQVPRSRRKKKK